MPLPVIARHHVSSHQLSTRCHCLAATEHVLQPRNITSQMLEILQAKVLGSGRTAVPPMRSHPATTNAIVILAPRRFIGAGLPRAVDQPPHPTPAVSMSRTMFIIKMGSVSATWPPWLSI